MTNPKPNRNLSLGNLRPHTKTKPKSPHAVGTIRIKRDLLLDLYQQMSQSDDDEVVANMAGWFNEDDNGKYLTIQVSAKYQRTEPRDCGKFFDFRRAVQISGFIPEKRARPQRTPLTRSAEPFEPTDFVRTE